MCIPGVTIGKLPLTDPAEGEAGRWILDRYGKTTSTMRRRPGKPIEMRSDLPSHVTSVRTTTATRAIVRRRGTVDETYSRDTRPARSEAFALSPDVLAGVSVAGCLPSQDRPHVSQLADLVPGGTARIPGTGGSIHLVVPPLRNTTSHVRPGGGSARVGSATNHIVATASPRTRIMSGTTGLGSLACPLARSATANPLTPTTPLAADTYPASTVCSSYRCPAWGYAGSNRYLSQLTAGREATLRYSPPLPRVATRTRGPRKRGT